MICSLASNFWPVTNIRKLELENLFCRWILEIWTWNLRGYISHVVAKKSLSIAPWRRNEERRGWAVFCHTESRKKSQRSQKAKRSSNQIKRVKENAWMLKLYGDFNKANLKKVLPNFHQHISCPTRGLNTLHGSLLHSAQQRLQSPLTAGFWQIRSCRHFSHAGIQTRIAREPPVEREVTRWSPHSEATLQASLDDVDWDMFRASSSDVSEFTDVAVSFVNTLTEQATETVTIRTFTNQKPWVDRSIRDAVNNRTAAYNAGLLSGTWANTKLRATLSLVQYEPLSAGTARKLSHISSSMTLVACGRDWRPSVPLEINPPQVRADPLLAEELNTFYGRFDCNGGANLPNCPSGSSRQSSNDHIITFSEDDVRRELKRVNVRKAAGPDGITGRVLRSCADQLAGLFTSIFNESLATSVVPTSFKNLS